jgi:hypothetical protein
LVVGLEEREREVKREFWDRAVPVISGDEWAEEIVGMANGVSIPRDFEEGHRVVVLRLGSKGHLGGRVQTVSGLVAPKGRRLVLKN